MFHSSLKYGKIGGRAMAKREYEITAQYNTNNVKEISVDWNGNNYLVIYGKHINGGFFSIPNWGVGGELSGHFASDVFGNTEYINRYLKNKRAAQQIAMAIAEMENLDL